MVFWDVINFLFIGFHLILVPLQICFGLNNGETLSVLTNFNFVLLACSIIISLNTGYFNKGELEENRTHISMNYLKNYIVIDLLALCTISDLVLKMDSYFRFLFLLKVKDFSDLVLKFKESLQLDIKSQSFLSLF